MTFCPPTAVLLLHSGTVLYPVVSPALSPSTSPAAAKSCPAAPLFSRGDLDAVPSERSPCNQEHTARVKLSQLLCIFRSCVIEDLESMLGMFVSSGKEKYYHVISKKRFQKGFEFPFREAMFWLDYVLLIL